jgi:hypothetical protein
MKHLLLVASLVALAVRSYGQIAEGEKILREQKADTVLGWKKGGIAGVNLSQTSFTNWSAGGQNSIAANALFSVFANRIGRDYNWDNSLDLGYGVLSQGKGNENRLVKTDDKIEATSKYGRRAFGNWFYAGLINFKTQFAPGYNYPNDSVVISNFMAPGYLLGAVGLDYKPNPAFSLFISPLTGKLTFVMNQRLANAGAFGVEPAVTDSTGKVITPGENIRKEIGGYIRAQYQKEIIKNVLLNTRVDLFSNYLDNPGNIDVNWNTVLALKVNEFIAATISTELIYDDDVEIAVDKNDDGVPERVGPRIQFKEVLAVGFN